MTVFNKSKIKFFEGHSLSRLEEEVNAFIETTIRVYNVKHVPTSREDYTDYHYIMVSYE